MLITLIVIGPMVLVINGIKSQAYVNYLFIKQKIFTGNIFDIECFEDGSFACKVSDFIYDIMSNPQIRYYIESSSQRLGDFIISRASDFIFSVPLMAISFFIMLFIVFYLLRDGKKIMESIEEALPIKKAHRTKVVNKFRDVTFAVFYGTIFVALIQGLLGALGFLYFGIPAAFLWGLVMAFFALIPFVGTPIVWLPVALYGILDGMLQNDTVLLTKGIVLLIWGTFVVSGIDNIIKPKIIGDRAKIHPVLVLLGVLGGIQFFGPIGIFIGPIILALSVTFIQIYREERILLGEQ